MNWNELTSLEQWNALWNSSEKILVFKHSTRCSISKTALARFERDWKDESPIKAYYLDLLNHRDISNQIAEDTGIIHESPQAIAFENKQVTYHSSHLSIVAGEIQA